MAFARPQHLVETAWLAEHLGDPGLRVLECTVFLQPADVPGGVRVESGRAKWSEGHIPGAGFIDLQDELSDRTSTLRFMMPPAAQFAEAMGRAGVGPGVRVVLYDRTTEQTVLVSQNSSGQPAAPHVVDGWPDVSSDGRFVVFGSDAINLWSGDTNNVHDVFLRDRVAGTARATLKAASPETPSQRARR